MRHWNGEADNPKLGDRYSEASCLAYKIIWTYEVAGDPRFELIDPNREIDSKVDLECNVMQLTLLSHQMVCSM